MKQPISIVSDNNNREGNTMDPVKIIKVNDKFYVEVMENMPEHTLVAGDVLGPFTSKPAADKEAMALVPEGERVGIVVRKIDNT